MIYIIKHREVDTPKLKGYKTLNVGDMYKYKNKDNINEYNGYISEITAIYYLWKNCKDDIVGQVHYRRFLLDNDEILSYDKAKELLEEYDFIFAERYVVGNGIYNNLRGEIGNEINQATLDKYYNKLIEIEPELEEYFKQTWFYPRHMYICKKELLNKYAEWLFPIILPMVEEFIEKDAEINQKQKLLGYLFERIFTYWILKNNLKVKELPYNETMDRLPVTEV